MMVANYHYYAHSVQKQVLQKIEFPPFRSRGVVFQEVAHYYYSYHIVILCFF